MKHLLTTFVLFFAFGFYVNAQDAEEKDSTEKSETKEDKERDAEDEFFNSFVSTRTFNDFANNGVATANDPFTVVLPRVETSGSKFLAKKWNNQGVIRTLRKKQIVVSNINYEVEAGAFALQAKESIYLLDGSKYGEIIFNGRSFKNLYNPISKSTRFLEVIAENDEFTLVKDYYLDIRETEATPGYGQKATKTYVKKSRYYIMTGERFEEFKLKKSSVLELLSNNSSAVSDYVKSNKLSYKKDDDLKKMIAFHQTL